MPKKKEVAKRVSVSDRHALYKVFFGLESRMPEKMLQSACWSVTDTSLEMSFLGWSRACRKKKR